MKSSEFAPARRVPFDSYAQAFSHFRNPPVTFSCQRDSISMGNIMMSFPETDRCDAQQEYRFALPSAVTFSPLRDIVSMNDRSTTFHELYARYADDVYRFAHWLSGNPDDAKDITSETFVRAFTGPNEPRLESVLDGGQRLQRCPTLPLRFECQQIGRAHV